MKKIALIAAMMAGTAAFATPPAQQGDMQVENEPQTQLPNDPYEGYEGLGGPDETQVYDGPDSYTPSQPPPVESGAAIRSQAVATFQPRVRTDYPTCSESIRDNCAQSYDPR
ncbi:hypothetical protein [Parasphingopyxis marina]|uniref:Uncharacterized protein n=1 Tax=Parasphingopyxis marina TaxID=2761622 RepID=A0A842HW18_9SPHN|nr:hypothetical protein [Parasphingopyxis marina]MBC2777306.1 hypothetical protein [Parasphingopyxis marina]